MARVQFQALRLTSHVTSEKSSNLSCLSFLNHKVAVTVPAPRAVWKLKGLSTWAAWTSQTHGKYDLKLS